MKFQLDDLQMYYEIKGEGTPILMLHGRPTDLRAMRGAFEPIFQAKTGWQRVYVDLPGMGQTTGGSWINGNDDVLTALVAFVDEVLGKRPFLVTGFSYGGYLARGLLCKKAAQMAGLMLFVPAMAADGGREVAPHRVFGNETALFDQYPAPFAEMFASIVVVHETAVIARQGEILGGLKAADPATMARISANYTLSLPLDEPVADYHKPVLIVTGKQDSVTGYEQAGELAKQFSRATYAVLDRAGHGLHMEQPALFNLLVEEWLARVAEDMVALRQLQPATAG